MEPTAKQTGARGETRLDWGRRLSSAEGFYRGPMAEEGFFCLIHFEQLPREHRICFIAGDACAAISCPSPSPTNTRSRLAGRGLRYCSQDSQPGPARSPSPRFGRKENKDRLLWLRNSKMAGGGSWDQHPDEEGPGPPADEDSFTIAVFFFFVWRRSR